VTNTATEPVDEDEATTPFLEDDREIAYRSEVTPQVSHGPAGRPAIVAPGAATGRRKEAVARVRVVPGSGQWTINGRTL
jgi:small subunit ribosomal protein S9